MQSDVTRRDVLQTLTVAGVTVSLSGCSNPFEFSGDEDKDQTETPMQSSTEQVGDRRNEPVRNGRFKVTIDGIEVSGFQHVTIPESTTESNGETMFEDLVMKRTVFKGDSTLRDWRDEMRQGGGERARRNVTVTLLSEEGQPTIEWRFTNAWVTKYEPPELVADGSEFVFESCTVTFDRMVREEY